METKDILSLAFGGVSFIGVLGGIWNRIAARKGIGGQFIRYIALVVGLPLAGALTFQGMMTEAVATLVLAILGYVFPGAGKEG